MTFVFDQDKLAVQEFWNRRSCGEVYATGDTLAVQLEAQARARYELEPYIFEFARFDEGRGRDVLEIGVGMGADHLEWAKESPRSLTGIDLTPRAIEMTRARLDTYSLTSSLECGDAECLPFPDESFDLVYSWGVLHHSPDTPRAVAEVYRVLRPGGVARVMIYHRWSITGYLLWLRYGMLSGRGLSEVYARYLESPGTKAYTVAEAERLFEQFENVSARSQLSFGDLLRGAVGQRHDGMLLRVAKRLWPRAIIRRVLSRHGLMLLVDAEKSASPPRA
ncbi:MAG TPA: class I SAM-dependent methyltransferase [Gemmatimonadaceae bacterium]